jgi:NAD(P)H-dependent flavin oxidoreductase YrpB (nitropropane dioxygenase family)
MSDFSEHLTEKEMYKVQAMIDLFARPEFYVDINGKRLETLFVQNGMAVDVTTPSCAVAFSRTGSIGFLEDIRNLLNRLKIDSTKVIRDNKRTNTFSIRINKRKDLVKIKEMYLLSPFYKRKKEAIDNI